MVVYNKLNDVMWIEPLIPPPPSYLDSPPPAEEGCNILDLPLVVREQLVGCF